MRFTLLQRGTANEILFFGLRNSAIREKWRPLLFGLILIVSLIFLPGGLETLIPRIKDRLFGWRNRKRAA